MLSFALLTSSGMNSHAHATAEQSASATVLKFGTAKPADANANMLLRALILQLGIVTLADVSTRLAHFVELDMCMMQLELSVFQQPEH